MNKRRIGCSSALPLLVMLAVASVAGTPLTNADVIQMTRRGMSVDEITHAIETSATDFDISYPAQLELQRTGVNPRIGNLMMQLTVRKLVAKNVGASGLNMPQLPPGITGPNNTGPPGRNPGSPPPPSGPVPATQDSTLDVMDLSDGQFARQQQQARQILGNHGCFGPSGPKAYVAGHVMVCQGTGSDMGPTSATFMASATTNAKGGLIIGGEHAIETVASDARFSIELGEVPGLDMNTFEPLIVRLGPSKASRTVTRTRMKIIVKLPNVLWQTQLQDDVVPTQLVADDHEPGGGGIRRVLKPAQPLTPGEYGIVLRRGGSPNMMIEDTKTDKAFAIVQAVWDFKVEG